MNTIGYWHGERSFFDYADISKLSTAIRNTHYILYNKINNKLGLAIDGKISSTSANIPTEFPLLGVIPPVYPEWLGDRNFLETHGIRYAYVGGAMARGIGSAELVIALAESGMLGFFGSAGLSLDRIQKEINTIKGRLAPQGLSWGTNLIHTPEDPELESKIVDLYLHNGITKIEAAAFMGLSPAIVHFAFKGLSRSLDGEIVRKNHVFAKISRPEVAKHFLIPVPEEILNDLVKAGKLSSTEADLGKYLPLAEDITVESDSGGHTDGRPLGPLFSEIMQLRNHLAVQYGYQTWPRLGAAGGLGTPSAVAAAYTLGAAYVCVGSVHQSCVESGMSLAGKQMLGVAGIADVAMTACADMFEQGVKVQVLKRGTMMPQRGNYLYSLYINNTGIDTLTEKDKTKLEKEIFRASLDSIWGETEAFFNKTDPAQVARAYVDPKHKMALIFRWYIGKSSQWPVVENKERQIDYQIWCGPAMGAFNTWVKGTYLEPVEARKVRDVALNLLEGAARIIKAGQLKTYALSIGEEGFSYTPSPIKKTNHGIQK